MSDTTAPTIDLDALRPFQVTASDHGAVVLIVATLLMVWAILCLLIRFYVRVSTSSSPKGADDLLCAAATVVGVIQTIIVGASVGEGFGQAGSDLGDAQLARVEKEKYVCDILCLLALYLSKCATMFLYVRITPRKDQQKICYGVVGIVIACGLASIIITAARCGGHLPWAVLTHSCSDYVPGWIAIAVLDVFTELLLFAMPIWILFDLQMATRTKIIVMSAFALRLPVIAASITHVSLINIWTTSTLPSVYIVTPFVCLQVEMQYAIMATTFPCLVPFMKSVNTRWGTMGEEEVRAYGTGSVDRSAGKSISESRMRSGKMGSMPSNEGKTIPLRSLRGTHGSANGTQQPMGENERRSSHGSDNSKQMIIRKTISTSVQFD